MKHEIRAVSNWAHWFQSWARPSLPRPPAACVFVLKYICIFSGFSAFAIHAAQSISIHTASWVIFQVLRAVCSAASVAPQRKGRDFLYACVLWVFYPIHMGVYAQHMYWEPKSRIKMSNNIRQDSWLERVFALALSAVEGFFFQLHEETPQHVSPNKLLYKYLPCKEVLFDQRHDKR